jgi:hypothetical protein
MNHKRLGNIYPSATIHFEAQFPCWTHQTIHSA